MKAASSVAGGPLPSLTRHHAPDRPKMCFIGILTEHPKEGLILFETGSGKDYPQVCSAPLDDIFAQINYDPVQELDKQIELTGHSIKDVKMMIMGHLHLDHAGGLEQPFGTDVPILSMSKSSNTPSSASRTKATSAPIYPHR